MKKYVLTGAAGNITKPLALHLIKAGHQVTVIGRNAENMKSLTDAGATKAIGSIEDEAFLTETFRGADAVYTMVPPNWAISTWVDYIGNIGEIYARAIKAAGVIKVVNLSSVGAHMPEGAGPVSGLYRVEQALNKLEGVDVLHLRPAYFYHNLMASVGLVKGMSIIGGNFGGDNKVPMVHPEDIAEAAFEALNSLSFNGQSVQYVVGDDVDGATVAKAIGEAIGKPELPWIQFEDQANLQGAIGAGVPPHHAELFTEMGRALRTGTMSSHYRETDGKIHGKRKISDFAKEFAGAYSAS
jgi:uncharacterized protein YbjT (DUF2867 family)